MSEHRGPLEEMENVPDANHLCGNNVDTHYERLKRHEIKAKRIGPAGIPIRCTADFSINLCLFRGPMWRATWYAWDYWLGFGFIGTLSSLAAGSSL